MVGNPLKADIATTHKEQLTYARILVEVSVNQQYPSRVMFENEHENIIEQMVVYEWKSLLCATCNNFGHEQQEC